MSVLTLKIRAAIQFLLGKFSRLPNPVELRKILAALPPPVLKPRAKCVRVETIGLHVWSGVLSAWVPLLGSDGNERLPPPMADDSVIIEALCNCGRCRQLRMSPQPK